MYSYSRKVFLKLFNRLLNLLESRIKQALKDEDIDTLREYGVYFDQIGQIKKLVQLYCDSKNDILVKYKKYYTF